MSAIVLGALLLSIAPATPAPPRAETYAADGEAHLRRATDDRSVDAFEEAHMSFDNAFLVAEDPRYLCRALAVAEQALRSAIFASAQQRLSWEELRRDDLDRLRADAAQAQRSNCRFDSKGKPLPPRVALIDPDGPVPAHHATQSTSALPASAKDPASASSLSSPRSTAPEPPRRTRARTAAGAVFTAAGVGLFGGLVGVLGLEAQRAAELKGMIRTAKGEGRTFTELEDQRAGELGAELLRGREVAIGIGTAGLVSLATGIAVLATGKKVQARRYAVQPYGGLYGAGAALRLRF